MLEKIEIEEKTCYMMVGIPGSGKSFLINQLTQLNPNLKVASSDYYIEKYMKENNVSYNRAYRTLDKIPFKNLSNRISCLLKEDKSFILDQTNTTIKSRIKKISRMKSSHFNVVALCLNVPKDILMERLKRREQEEGKIISYSVIENILLNYENPNYDEGFEKIYNIDEKLNVSLVFKPNNFINKGLL